MNIIHHISELKDINYMMILIGEEKFLDKIEHAFMIKVPQAVVLKGRNIPQYNIYI